MLGKGLNNACKSKDVPFEYHSIVEKYSCDSESKECMLNSSDGLTVNDVGNGEANEDDSDSDSETNMVTYYQWKRGDGGYLTS